MPNIITKNLRLPYPTEGVIRSAEMNDTTAPADSDQLGINIIYDQIGARKTRLGITLFADSLGEKILSLAKFAQNFSTNRQLLAQIGNIITRWNGSAWLAVRTLTSTTNKARYSQFLNLVYTVNGSNGGGDPIQTYNGTSYSATNVGGLPKGDYVQAGYEGRVWVADATNDRLYYSNIVTVNGVITTSLFITYTPGSNTFEVGGIITGGTSGATGRVNLVDDVAFLLQVSPISGTFQVGEVVTENNSPAGTGTITVLSCPYIEKLSPQDGESITCLHRIPRALLVFKQNHIFRVYSATNIDAYPAYNVGTFSNESVVETKDGLYFHHPSGFYRFQYDGQPQELSRRIIDFVRAIPRSYYENVTGAYDGFDNITWSIGSVTVEGVLYQNCQVRYTVSTQVWTIYDLSPGYSPSAMLNYDNGNIISQLVGTEQGQIFQTETGLTDNGDSIYFDVITRWMSFSEIWSAVKEASSFYVNSVNGAGAEIMCQTDKDAVDKWDSLGKLNENYSSQFPSATTGDFNRMRLRIKGITKGPQIIFDGIEIGSITNKGFDNN